MATSPTSAASAPAAPPTAIGQLPLRELGFDNLPAVPVDVAGMADMLIRLGTKAKQYEQALQGLTGTYTIGGSTARAYTFLYGADAAGQEQAAARARLGTILSRDLSEVPRNLAAQKLGERDHGPDAAHELTTLALEDPTQWSMGWSTLPDVASLGAPVLDEYAATVDVERPDMATAAFFPMLARHGRSYNLMLPRKVRPADVGSWRALFDGTWTPALDAAAATGLLYVIDLRIYESLEPHVVAGAHRFTPSTVTVLVQDPVTKALTPELIRVAGAGNTPKVFSRQGSATAAAWVYALQAAKVGITVFGIWLGHVYQTHLVTAAMQMTMFNHLSRQNPARRLLEPQSSFLIPFDDVLLLEWTAAAPPTSISSSREFLELVDRYADGRAFFDDDPPAQLARLGIEAADFTVRDPWDQFPIIGDYLAIWEATGRYVETYVDRAYARDEDVRRDGELAAWIAASGDPGEGNLRGLPAMDGKDALRRVLHSLVYRITMHASSRLYRSANPALTFVANFPPCLQDATIPEPSATFDTKALHRYLPTTGSIGAMLHFYFIFWASPPYVSYIPLGGVESDLFFEDEVMNAALVELRRFVIGFIAKAEPDTPQIWQWERNIEL
jgi:hypothetical protein